MSPDDEALAERGRALIAETMCDVTAPLALRERLELRRTSAARRRRPRLRLRWAFVSTALCVAALAATLLPAPGGAPRAPSVVEAARLADGLPVAAVPQPDRADPRILTAAEGGLRFPSWKARGWSATAEAAGTVRGLRARAVRYRTQAGDSVTYTVVRAAELRPPRASEQRRVDGRLVSLTPVGSRWVLSWEARGSTCLVSVPASATPERVWALARST